MLPLMLNAVSEGRISLEMLSRAMSEKTAKIFGVYPRKGAIQVGADADLVVVDLKRTVKIDKNRMFSKARDLTPYDGWEVKGYPVMTLVRGIVVMREGEVTGKPGCGVFISPMKSKGIQ